MKLSFLSITLRVVILMVVLVGIVSTVTAYIVYRGASSALQNSISSNQLAISQQIMDKLDRYLYEREVEIETATTNQQIVNYLSQPKDSSNSITTIGQSLDDISNVSGDWSEIEIFNTTGQLQAASAGNQQTSPMINNPALLAIYSRATMGETVYSDAFLLPSSNTPTMAFMSPIRSDNGNGQPIGVLEGYLAWPTVLEVLQSLTNVNTNATLLNARGLLLGSNNSTIIQPGILTTNYSNSPDFKYSVSSAPGSKILPGLTLPDKLFVTSYVDEDGYLNYQGNNWSLILGTSKNVAFLPITHLAITLTLTFSIFLIGVDAAFIFTLNRLVIKPIRTLKAATQRLADGDLSQSVKITSKDEVGQLGAAFNDMAKSLQDSSRKLYEEHARLLASINSLEAGYIMTGEDRQILLLNNAARKLLAGKSAEPTPLSLSLQQVTELLKGSIDLPNILEQCMSKWEMVDIKELGFGDLILHVIVGPVLIKSTDNKTNAIGCVVLLEDITESIVAARSKDEFFSIASHELRTPLTSIRGNSSMIMDFYKDILKDQQLKEMIEDINVSSVRLIEIVNDFLDVSRLEQGKMKFNYESISVEKVIESVAYEMKTVLTEKKIYLKVNKLTLDSLPLVWADKSRLEQVIYNLVGNASKFTEKGGILISAELDGNQKFVKVLVADTGRGMSSESQQLLFHKFQQASSSILTRDTTRGTGLGLYISKMIIENMGGIIRLEASIVNRGTVFSFTIPVATIQRQATATNTITPTDTVTGLSSTK